MSRLITFGCSVTYGHGLSDCLEELNRPGPEPSKQAWPNLLATRLNKKLINTSTPGASNLEILFHILNFPFDPDDLIVILWTYPSRDMIFSVPTKEYRFPYIPLGVWHDSNLAKSWLATHTDHDLIIRSWLSINHGELYLNNNNLRNNSFFVDIHQLYDRPPEYLKFTNINLTPLTNILASDLAIDTSHPGPIAHRNLCEFMSGIVSSSSS